MQPFTLDQLTAAPRTLRVAGRAIPVRPLALRDWGALQAWLKDHGESPLRALRSADLDGLSDADRRQVLGLALDRQRQSWPPPVATPEWFRAMDAAPGGNDQFLLTLLRTGDPAFTPEAARAVADAMTPADVLAATYLAIGLDPPDPKAPAPADAGGKPPRRRKKTGARGSTPGAPTSTP